MNTPYDIVDLKTPLFLSQPGIEHHLEEQIAQFIFQPVEIAGVYCVDHLVGFLQEQSFYRIAILGSIPGASFWSAQTRHQFNQFEKFFSGQNLTPESSAGYVAAGPVRPARRTSHQEQMYQPAANIGKQA